MTPSVPAGGGILPVDKEPGPTSHDVVAMARRSLGLRRVGHTGTLDPFASGLLLLLVGPLTRLSPYLTGQGKSYTATLKLGETTDTDDAEGVVVTSREGWDVLGEDEIRAAMVDLTGPQLQRPPVYSAKKIGGDPAHRRMRRGEEVQLPPSPVLIHDLELEAWRPPHLDFSASVGSGTYIRALGRDLGEILGVGGHLVELRRESVGPIPVERAISMRDLREGRVEASSWLSPLEALPDLLVTRPSPDNLRRLRLGQPMVGESGAAVGGVDPGAFPEDTPVMVVEEGGLIAMARVRNGRLWPRTVFPPVGSAAGGAAGK